MNAHLFKAVLPPILVAAGVGVLLECVVRAGGIAPYLLPLPSKVLKALVDDRRELLPPLWETTRASFIGFSISAVVGVALAIALSSARWVQRAFYPYAVLFQTVPLIAVAPLLVVWFDNSIRAVVACSVIVSVFPIIANTLAGLLSTDPALRDLFKLHRAGALATLWKLRLPFALPNILTGLRIGGGLAVIGVIAGELVITGDGLGGEINVWRQQQNLELVFAGLILSALLGIAFFLLINAVSAFTLRHWHASEKE
ncbi:MAG: ABC transporter permease [Tepidisphaeraceae bacterium]